MQTQRPSDISVTQFTMEPLKGGPPRVLALSPEPEAEPPEPPDAPVQDILFQPPGSEELDPRAEEEPDVYSFVMSDPHIELRMRRVVRYVYANYGSAGLKSLEAAILGNPKRPWGLRGEPYHHLENEPVEFVWSDSEKKLVPRFLYTKAPLRSKLGEQFQRELKLLEGPLEKTRTFVKSAAIEVAQERLEKSRKQVLDEIKRYVDLRANSDEVAAAVLNDNSLAYLLTGKDVIPLASAFLRIEEGRKPIREAQAQYQRIAEPVNKKRAEWMKPEIDALSDEEVLMPLKLIEIARKAQEAFPDTPEMIQAQGAIVEAHMEFAFLVAEEAVKFPILYRLWDSPTPEVLRKAIVRSRSTNIVQYAHALSLTLEFRDAVLTTLRRTWGAANRTLERIKEDKLNVWHYPTMVTAALNQLAVPPGTVEWMAANEQVEREKGASIASALSMASVLFEMALMAVGSPAGLVVSVLNLLWSVWEFVKDLLQRLEEQDAFDASLNPALSFAAEPSYIGLVVSLAFLALAGRGTVKAVTGAKAAAREAAEGAMNMKVSLNDMQSIGFVAGRRLGAELSTSALNLVSHSDEGAKLLKSFYRWANLASIYPGGGYLGKLDRAAERLEKLGAKTLKGAALKAFRGEIEQRTRVAVFRAQTLGARMPKSARLIAVMSESERVMLDLHSARYQAAAINRLMRPANALLTDSERLASLTYPRLLTVIGHQYSEGWSRVFDYCALYADGIAEAARQLRAVEKELTNLLRRRPDISEMLRQAPLARGYFYPIRGSLGEIYLHHWPNWRIQMSSLLEIAAGNPLRWRPMPFSGGALIDGLKAWDEGILLIKPPQQGDRLARAAVDTGVQVKVAKEVKSIDQTINDRLREIGKGAKPPTLTIIQGNKKRDFVLEALPPGVASQRYIFYARGGRISAAQIARLKAYQLQVTAMPLDISIDEFDAITLEIIYAVEAFLKR